MTGLQEKKAADAVAVRCAVSALAAALTAVFVCGCDMAAGKWSLANGRPPVASSFAAPATAGVAPRDGNGIRVAMAASAVTDTGVALDQQAGAKRGMERFAQVSNQHHADRQRSRTAAPAVTERRPLVVIRFDRPDVPYEPALYTAVSRALERRPSAVFDLVAVSPSSGSEAETAHSADEAQRDAERVMRALSKMGLPADRVTLSAMFSTDILDNEVRIFVR
jgi:hypothetical protein